MSGFPVDAVHVPGAWTTTRGVDVSESTEAPGWCPTCETSVSEAEMRVRADGVRRHSACDTAVTQAPQESPPPVDMRTVIAYIRCMLDAPAEYPQTNEILKGVLDELEALSRHGTGVSDRAGADAAIRSLCRIWTEPEHVNDEWTSPDRVYYARHEASWLTA
jgi:hypothetical protein